MGRERGLGRWTWRPGQRRCAPRSSPGSRTGGGVGIGSSVALLSGGPAFTKAVAGPAFLVRTVHHVSKIHGGGAVVAHSGLGGGVGLGGLGGLGGVGGSVVVLNSGGHGHGKVVLGPSFLVKTVHHVNKVSSGGALVAHSGLSGTNGNGGYGNGGVVYMPVYGLGLGALGGVGVGGLGGGSFRRLRWLRRLRWMVENISKSPSK
ncbi:hypothetical protein MTO96_009110 [Rhipicephalus appendiculatus]